MYGEIKYMVIMYNNDVFKFPYAVALHLFKSANYWN